MDKGLSGRKTRITLGLTGPFSLVVLFVAVKVADRLSRGYELSGGFGLFIVGIPIVLGVHLLAAATLIAVATARAIVYRHFDLATGLGLLYYATILAVVLAHR